MSTLNKRLNEASDAAMAEFLAKGGVVQQIATGVSGRPEGESVASAWGRPKAGRPPAVKPVPVIDVEDDE
jgi:hypothetical protein